MNNETQQPATENLLDRFSEKARQAHYWTSFSPEKRGDQLIKDYGEQLGEDIAELTSAGIDADIIEGYKSRYTILFSSWLNAKGRCISSMITGPARFPTRKAEKANRSEHNHYELWQVWREKAKKAIIRKSQPAKTYVSEIDRYKSDLEGMKANHEKMKQGNIAIKKALKEGKDITEYLTNTFGIQPHMINWHMKFGFGLQNNLANMKRVELRIKELSAKEEMRQEKPESGYRFNGGEVVFNFEADRVQLLFDSKPDETQRNELKRNGFKWSPRFTAWQRQLTANGINATKRLFPAI